MGSLNTKEAPKNTKVSKGKRALSFSSYYMRLCKCLLIIFVIFVCYRNCLVGKGYQIKISDFGTDNEAYSSDYYKVNGSMALPVRWMACESVFLVSL